MGYSINTTHVEIAFTEPAEESAKQALAAINLASAVQYISLTDMFQDHGVDVEITKDGLLECINGCVSMSRKHDSDTFEGVMKILAPFVTNRSFIELCGEDGMSWRIIFFDGKSDMIYPAWDHPDLVARTKAELREAYNLRNAVEHIVLNVDLFNERSEAEEYMDTEDVKQIFELITALGEPMKNFDVVVEKRTRTIFVVPGRNQDDARAKFDNCEDDGAWYDTYPNMVDTTTEDVVEILLSRKQPDA